MELHFNKLDVKQRMDQMVSKLREHDFRITPQRLAVLRILAASEGHPSVERVYETVRREFPTTTIATVYKTVRLLKQLNEVLELGFPDGSNRYDGNKPFPHPHVICVRCRKIIDPDLGTLKDMTAEVADETGFDILAHRLDFFGICGDCKKKEKSTKTQKEGSMKKSK
jgi:Fur family peroxide stress response transcriptional regulator